MKRLPAILVLLSLSGLTAPASPEYITLIRGHYDKLLETGRDDYGPEKTPLWLASVDIAKGGLPEQLYPEGLRWYRDIVSPGGSNLYWDQAGLVTALELTRLTNDARYAEAARAYVEEFARRCVGENGLFLWGNHIYYDVTTDLPVFFTGGHHEIRPHVPAWDFLGEVEPDAVAQCIHRLGEQHVTDHRSGLFNRHASVSSTTIPGLKERAASMPFLESGGVIVESLAWLSRKSGDPAPVELALKVARYSASQKEEKTGLLRNQPIVKRWDYEASTTEIGLWAGNLLRAADYSGEAAFREIAGEAMKAWLARGFDSEAGLYYGQLAIADGRPLHPPEERGYQPAYHAEIWETGTMPTHNYPMPMAEASLTLLEQTGDPLYRLAAERWIGHVQKSLPALEGRGAYAEEYGRVIHFLIRASRILENPEALDLAREVAGEAFDQLFSDEHGMFRSHPGEDRCDAVDNAGLLFLALIWLQTGEYPEMKGLSY